MRTADAAVYAPILMDAAAYPPRPLPAEPWVHIVVRTTAPKGHAHLILYDPQEQQWTSRRRPLHRDGTATINIPAGVRQRLGLYLAHVAVETDGEAYGMPVTFTVGP